MYQMVNSLAQGTETKEEGKEKLDDIVPIKQMVIPKVIQKDVKDADGNNYAAEFKVSY
jgi:hypothetical protein